MSERDCGSWYCQNAHGFRKLVLGEDLLFNPAPAIRSGRTRDLDAKRMGLTGHVGPPARPASKPLGGWFGDRRAEGWTEWLGAYQDGGQGAHHFWMWDPDSRGKYFEVRGPFRRGQVPADIGELHRGRGWQLPICVAMEDEPSEQDIIEMRQGKVPYFILGEVDEPPVCDECGEDPCVCEDPVDPPSDECLHPNFALLRGRDRLNAKLDHIICLLEG